jgi:adenosylcobinamide kinase/adenosylcobinamide-phosphate guanylyltransferase
MEVAFAGTGGRAGWPEPGCRCASCGRAAAGGRRRAGRLLVDGVLPIEPDRAPPPVPGYRVAAVPGGWDVTGPDGARLLAAAAPGARPDPPAGTAPYGLLVLDLLGSPAGLGLLRARELAGGTAAAGWADHRVTSAAELARRCALWGAVLPSDGDTLAVSRPGSGGAGGPGGPHRTLVLGGARSGKSREAELRLAGEPEVTYVAAGPWPDGHAPRDAEWAARVAAHQAARPPWWRTLETADVAGALPRLAGAVLVDGLGTWLTAVLTEAGAWSGAGPEDKTGNGPAAAVAARIDELVGAWRAAGPRVVAVSDQVGEGVVPATPAGRLFRDLLGGLNQRLAAESEETVLVVAGRVISLPP